MWFQVSALAFCLVAVVAAVPTIAPISSDESAVADRRTFKKHTKRFPFPLVKKHKKFGGWLPHIFGKTQYTGVPTPIYKVHRYHGLELKPVTDIHEVSFLPHSPAGDDHTFEHHDFVNFDEQVYAPAFPEEHDFQHFSAAQPFVQHVSYPVNFAPTPVPLAPAPAFSFVQHHVPASSLQPNVVHFSTPEPPLSPWPAASVAPVSVPKPLVPNVQTFHHSVAVSTTPAPALAPLTSFTAKLPTPSVAPAQILPPLSLPSPFAALPFALPSPPALPPLPVLPSVSTTPAPAFHTPELPEKVETSVTVVEHDKHPDPTLVPPRPDVGFFQNINGWKPEKPALSTFKPLPVVPTLPTIHKPVEISNFHAPLQQTFHFPTTVHPPTANPPQVFFPPPPSPAPFLPVKYESFPPYPSQPQPQLFNSYGVPIPHDSYGPPHHFTHDRVSSAASEEKTSVLPAPPSFTEKTPDTRISESQQEEDQQQQQSEIVTEYQKTQQQALHSDVHPVYKLEESQTGVEGVKEVAPESVRSINPEENHQENQEE
ncbi:hypothetical protein RUM44_002172 [Polyplax serrata]|uniref:Uncharacterized protein n=1 Tax=Polyplax serrata TaxID=468196 RepID=A0ABR1AM45_POLSC